MKRRWTMKRWTWLRAYEGVWQKQRRLLFGLAGLQLLLLALGMLSPLLFKQLVDRVMVGQNLNALWWICGGYIGIYLLDSAIRGGQTAAGNRLSNRLTFTLRRLVWGRYVRMPFAQYERMNKGDLKNRIEQDVDAVDRFFSKQLLEYGFSWSYLLVGGVMMFAFSWQLALFGMLMVPVSFWMVRWLGKGARRTSEQLRQRFGQYEGWLAHSLRGWKEIKANGMEKRVTLQFTVHWHAISKAFFRQHMYWYGNRSFQAVKDFFITRMNVYFIGGLLIIYGDMSIGTLLVFMMYYEQFFSHIGKITEMDLQLAGDIPSLERVKEMIGETSKQDKMFSEGAVGVDEVNGEAEVSLHAMTLQQVSYRYDGMNRDAIENISLQVERGSRVAIVGRSGSGKSTLAKLMLGMYEPSVGEVCVGGRRMTEVQASALRREIGVVMQDPAIFNMSIADNVRLARPDASDVELEEACKLAYMDEFVSQLPERYETMIGERGVQLSGGQRQRLALARVILSKVSIVVLDEATSMLDHASEVQINAALEQLTGERTFIVIAHRFSSVRNADRILLMDNGRLVDEGKHEELWERSELYRMLFQQNAKAV
ncbi:putative multidrug export ATP-binding/permease protein YgaD [Paenibacillus sp. CCS19]|uniref:ABC transporter ATP-binding protein n=1 Tax=Paenibacillus sp. CCS19 TaxID=3158387 RepID=UPI0025644B17|nr:ABC transporter ATP-binding protein [Paenibacillus cellulosilyticus]GMK37165.1 putative multidrug export ATP-binding/permease protein YgaD [Paenibacillus cellulosilyticus]